MLIALFERAVSFYASLVNINAYHQPGVEAGKKAATDFLNQLAKVRDALTSTGRTPDEVAAKLGIDPEDAFHMLNHLVANDQARIVVSGDSPAMDQFAAL